MRSWNEIRKAATAFSKRWKDAYDEKSQAQSFLKEFFAVFGVDAVTVATFEHRVKFADGSQGYADCFWPGMILVEMKSRGKDLDAADAYIDCPKPVCEGVEKMTKGSQPTDGGNLSDWSDERRREGQTFQN